MTHFRSGPAQPPHTAAILVYALRARIRRRNSSIPDILNAMQYGKKLPNDVSVRLLSPTGSEPHPLSWVTGVTQRRIGQSTQADRKLAQPFVMGGGYRLRAHVEVHNQRSPGSQRRKVQGGQPNGLCKSPPLHETRV